MSQPTLNALNNTQNYLNQFKKLDKDNLGYLNVAQVKDYFKSQQLPQDDLIELASRTNQGRLTPEQFASAMNLSQMKNHDDIGYHSSKLSSLLRHCEESMKLFEQDKRMNVQSSDSKDKLLEAFKVLEDFMKQFIKSLDDTPSNNDAGPNRSTVPSTFEKMPGTYDFDAASSDMTSRQQSMTSPATTPVFLKNPSFRDIPESPNARHNEKEPALEPPSPLPQMNDAAFMSGLKPISGKNLNGDDAKPNNAHESDTYRSNVLDSLRNAAMDDAEIDDNHSKEREILFEDESHERAVPTASTRGITSNTNNALEYGGVNNSKPDAIIPRSSNKQSSDTNTKVEPQPATSSPSDVDAEKAIAPLAASVATVAAATATAAIALSDIDKGDSHPASPLETATDETHAPETFHGDLGHNGTEPFIEDAEDTELKPELQPSSAKWNKLNTNDAESSDYMDTAIADARSLSPKSSDFNQFENKKPFQRETFQGGLGGNGTEPYIKNEKDALLKPEDQPSFGAKQERLKYANDEKIESNDMEQPNVSKASTNKDSPYASEFFQGGLGGNGTEAYIKNEKDTWSRSEDKPSFDAEQKQPRKLNGFDTENEEVGALKDTDQEVGSSPSLGSTLSKIGAGAAGVAGAAALGLSEHNDNEKDKDRSIDLAPSNDASEHSLTSPRNAYSPSLTSGNSLENANHADVISDEALSDIADKVNEDIKHNDLKDNSATIDKDGVVSSDASDKVADNLDAALKENAVPTSTSLDVSPQKDINVLVDRDTSLPPNIDNEVDIETTNNGSNRSPLAGETTTPPTVLDSNDNANVTPSLNSAYTGSSSANPDSVYRAAPALDNDKPGFESHIPAAPAVSTPNISSTSRSLNPNDEIKDDYPRESPNDDANNKEDNPGFFKRLLKSRSRSPEPTSRSISAISDKAISKDSASPTAESRDSSKSADAPIVAKVDVSQGNAPSVALNTTGNLAGSDNALEGISPDVHDAGASLNTPEINASAPSAIFSSNIETPAVDFSNAGSKLDNSLDTHSSDNGIKSPGFNANVNMDASGLSNSLRNMSADIKGLKDNASGKFDGSVDSPTVGGNLLSTSFPNVDRKLDGSLEAPDIDAKLPSINSDLKSPSFNTDISVDRPDLSGSLPKISSGFRSFKDDVDDKFNGSIDTPDIDGKLLSLNAKLSGVDGGIPISDSDMTAPKLDMPAFDGKLTGYIDPPSADGNLPSVNTDLKSPSVEPPSVSGKLDRSINTPDVNDDLKSPNVGATIDRPDLSSSLGKLSSSFQGLKDDISGKFNGSVDTPDIDGKSPSLSAKLSGVDGGIPISDSDMTAPKLDMPAFDGKLTGYIDPPSADGNLPSVDTDLKSPDVDLPDVGAKLDRSVISPEIESDIKSPDLNANVNMNTTGLSSSLGKLSAGLKDLKSDISGNFDRSVDSPHTEGTLPTFDANVKDLKDNISGKLNVDTPSIDNDFPSLAADFERPNVDLPDVDGKFPSVDAGMKGRNANLPDIGGKLPSLDPDLKTPKLEKPSLDVKLDSTLNTPDVDGKLQSLDTDIKGPKVDLPDLRDNLEGSISTPEIDAKLPSVDRDLNTSDANVDANLDASRPTLSGFGKLSSNFQGLKDDISGKFSGSVDTPDIDGKSPSLSAKLSGVDGGLPISDSDMTAPKLDMPAFDGKLTGYIDPPSADGNLPSVNTDLKSPSVEPPSVSGKLDRSFNTPDVNDDLKSPDVGATIDRPDLSSSLGKLSSSFKGLKDEISGKFTGSVDNPDADGRSPSLSAKLSGVDGGIPISDSDMTAPKLDMPAFDGKLTGYIDPPSADGNLPSVNTDLKSPSVEPPSVSGKLDRSINTPDVNDDLKSPDVGATIDRPDLSSSLGKLSSSFKGLKDEISGKFTGSVDNPDADGRSPSLSAKLSGVDGGIPISDSDMTAPKLDMPAFDGKLTGYIDPPSADGNLPSVNTDLKSPSADLPNISGKLDRSISAPDIDSNMKISGFNANSNVDTSGVSASLDKLSAGLTDIKDDIPSKFDDSVQSNNIDSELPTVGTNLKGSSMETPNAAGKLDDSIQEPDFGGKLSSLDTDLKGSNIDVSHGKYDDFLNADLQSTETNLPNISGNLDKSIDTPEIDTTLPSVDGKLESPKVDADANADAGSSSLSGALGKLSSGFKGLKDEITGVFSGSADASKVDNELPSANTDYCSPKFGLPDADLELDGSVDTPNISSDLPFADGELNTPGPSLSGGNINLNSSINTPGMNAKLPHLDTNLDEGDSGNLPSISGSRGFDSSVAAPKADVDVPDMHTPNLDASADGNISTAFVAPPRKIELSGSLGEVNAGLTTPKTDVDVPRVAADNDSPVAPPRSPRLSLNKLSSKTNLDSSVKSSNMDVDVPETSSGFKSPSFNVPVNGEPALESDLSTGLHRNASADASGSGSISADKADGEGPSSFFSKPIEKINGAVGNYDDQISENDETHDRKTSTGYATLRTRSRNESPDNLSAMLDDIVKRRFSNTPSETDVSSVISDKKANKKESASHKSTNLDASASLNTGVSEPHASLGGDKPRSTVSDSRFKELPEQEGEVTEYSTPITSPVLTKAAPSAAVTAPSVTLDKIDGLESDVEKQLDAMSVSVSEAPQVPAHEEDSLPSPSRTHRSSISLQSTSFHDRSAADAIKSVYDNMTSKLMTGGPKSGNGTDDRVLKVRDGFENFNGFGVKCVSDNEDEEKHTAPSSALK